MKIGILTYHRADNFGAALQTYALQTFLKGEGHAVEIVDYRCKKIEAQYQIFSPCIFFTRKNVVATFRDYMGRFGNVRDRIVRRQKMKEYREKYFIMTSSLSRIRKPLDYDVVITGSDQVWNFHLNKGSENIYLLDFPIRPKTLRVAYAASSEENGMSNIDEAYLVKCLQKFDEISVRETFVKDMLRGVINKDIKICLDPTFLLTKEQYEKIAVCPKRPKYVLVYHMTYAPEVLPLAHRVADGIGVEVVELFGSFIVHDNSHQVTRWSPTEVLGYIKGAELVFTTSFHGLALSLILNKEVWVVNRGGNKRQKNLLKMAGLNNRLLSDMGDFREEKIDYKKVADNLSMPIQQSKDFLNFYDR